jgi:transcription antitermination protein NusB
MTGVRRKSRIIALQALYELDCTRHKADEILAHLAKENRLALEAVSFSEELVRGVIENKSELDGIVMKMAPAFPIEQMSIIDRNILRLAIFEILLYKGIPFKVTINEAVELAKRFGSDSSPRLINGVLATVVANMPANRIEEKTEPRE